MTRHLKTDAWMMLGSFRSVLLAEKTAKHRRCFFKVPATGVLGFGKISQQLETQRKKGWINWIFGVNGWINKVILRRLTIFVRLRPL